VRRRAPRPLLTSRDGPGRTCHTLRVVAEDYRVTVRLNEDGHADQLVRVLHGHEVEEDARSEFGERIAVSASGDHLFLYADTESAARHAQGIVEQLLEAHGMVGGFKLDRWHHAEEVWEDLSVPMPSTPKAEHAEHERLEQQERADSEAAGIAEWELRIELASHHDAHGLAERLSREGFKHIVRRWKFLILGTDDEDDAHALAERLAAEVPEGATMHVEPGGGLAWECFPKNPFAVFGGLGS
jgi:hypothetical protein